MPLRPPRQASAVPRRLILLAAIAVVVVVLVWRVPTVDRGTHSAPTRPSRSVDKPVAAHPPAVSRFLVARRAGRLSAPIQDAAAAALDGTHVVLLGGLTAQDTSTAAAQVVSIEGDRSLGRLPSAVHDAAAVRLGGAFYLLGGGNGSAQTDEILRVDTAGRTAIVGRLPAPSSDQAAAAIGGTAYVVGGFTGSRWLDTIVAWRPGAKARIVGHLATPLRYAAVTAVAGRLVIAGGSLPRGTASAAVLAFAPATGRVVQLGRLPAPTTHAAAAALGRFAYVIGGRGSRVGTPTARIVSIDARSGRIRRAGRLPIALSDLAATTLGGRILVAGGRSLHGTQAVVSELVQASKPAGAARPRPRVSLAAPANIYAADGPTMLAAATVSALSRVYVPNSDGGSVDVIDPRTFRVVDHFSVLALPEHITPSYDLRTLYVDNDVGNALTPIDPATGRPGKPIPVDDPYNLYFTPDGSTAIVVAERLHRLDFRDPTTLRLEKSLSTPCAGVNHMDFSADGSYAIVSCEFSGQLLKLDLADRRIVRVLDLPRAHAIPQDVRVSPDGRVFYVADLAAGGVWKVAGSPFRLLGFVPTGAGAHGLVVSRDARHLYVANRNDGSVSVISFRTGRVVAKWRLPGGGSPDMGGVSADGKVLWLSGRYNAEVYAIDTNNGRLLARIRVGASPHGLCVWPQPGRYSLGHTGILR